MVLPGAGTETGTDSNTSDLLFATAQTMSWRTPRCNALSIHMAVERDAA
ncbi:hypothetical protein BSU04_27885 [Caballeronia sordidicola]|uniref:Uncharacterized protein n=1 Tax=Caballeronia sordidicola TaxID=196367 RepID=A0A226WWU8_CABSO|nr:hypothetical protein BSU04_27885 [Caballeronia sordidicola]